MTVYRDCSTLDGANFDNPAAVTIYRGDNAPYNLVENISAGIVGGVEFVPPDDIPCLIPPSLCFKVWKWPLFIFKVQRPTKKILKTKLRII